MGLSVYLTEESMVIWSYLFLVAGVFWVWGVWLYKILGEFLPRR